LSQALNLLANAVVYSDCGGRIVSLNVIEDRETVFKGQDGLLDIHGSGPLFAGCGGTAFCEVGFHFDVWHGRTGILEGLVYLGAKPCVVSAAVWVNSKGRAPSFAVRVRRMRTASETVMPNSSRTAEARSFTSGSMRV
jgi:hypothetical protein